MNPPAVASASETGSKGVAEYINPARNSAPTQESACAPSRAKGQRPSGRGRHGRSARIAPAGAAQPQNAPTPAALSRAGSAPRVIRTMATTADPAIAAPTNPPAITAPDEMVIGGEPAADAGPVKMAETPCPGRPGAWLEEPSVCGSAGRVIAVRRRLVLIRWQTTRFRACGTSHPPLAHAESVAPVESWPSVVTPPFGGTPPRPFG